jgi:TonB-linked SusC/RagA family outer membrane protein
MVSNAAHDAAGLARLSIAQNPESLGAGTDWQDQIYQTALMQNYTLSATGGGDAYNFSFSGSYLGQEGTVKKTDYDRLNLRIKSDFTKGRLKIGESIILTKEFSKHLVGGLSSAQGGNPVGSSLKMIPVFGVYDPTAIGGFAGAYGPVVNVANPLAQLNVSTPNSEATNVLLNTYAEVSLFKGLKYKLNLGYTNTFDFFNDFIIPYQIGTLFTNLDADLFERRNENKFVMIEHTLNYNKVFGKHNIQALAGYAFQKNQFRELTGSKSGMPNDIRVLNAGTTSIAAGSFATETTLLSYLGRLVYSFDDRYVLTTTFRRDGSSRFRKDYRYGNFPSFALAWNASNEAFLNAIKPLVNTLKIRASYGRLGNQEIDPYSYTPVITLNTNYSIGQTPQLWPGAIQTTFATPDIKWENSETYNIGADMGLFNNKLSFTADYFIRKTTDVLIRVPIPISAGATTSPFINAGQITNKGVEAALSYRNTLNKDFTYQFTGTISAIQNNVDKLGTGTQQIFGGQPTHFGGSSTITQAGYPVAAFYLIKTEGIFNSLEEVNANSKNGQLIQPKAKPGDIRFADYNDDGRIDQNDRQYRGSSTPDLSFGFGSDLSWKNFDLSIFFQGTLGNKIYNGIRQDLDGMNLEFNYSRATLNAWTPDNHTNFPRAVINDPNLNTQTSDRFLENGSYLRCKTLQLGYNFPASLLKIGKISNGRIYVSSDNLFTITAYKGFNPDLGRGGSILDRGVDFPHVAYPLARTILFGVQLSL